MFHDERFKLNNTSGVFQRVKIYNHLELMVKGGLIQTIIQMVVEIDSWCQDTERNDVEELLKALLDNLI